MTFSGFVGHEDAKLALILNAIDFNCGGVLFVGEKGSGKTTLARLFRNLLPEQTPFVEIPLNVTEDVLLGGIDLEGTIRSGRKVFQRGILDRAHGGVIYIDDINLLSPELIALILEAQGRGENIIEREGLALKHPVRFILVASMNPEEGALSPHLLDRFGMCVLWESIKKPALRIEVMKEAVPELIMNDEDEAQDEKLRQQTARSLLVLKNMKIPEGVKEYITAKCMENCISGHRGDLFLLYASRAYAAFCGCEEVTEKHVDEVLPLVLTHRKRILKQMEKQQREQKEEKQQSKQDEHTDRQKQSNPQSEKTNPEKPHHDSNLEMDNPDASLKESTPQEEVFPLGNTFKTRHFVFRKDRLNRIASGRRTKTKSKDKGGRYVKSILQPRKDIAIDATIRAAAPFQKIRGREEMLLIHDEDLRFKQREKKMGHLAIFVVDGSGSMGAQGRMVETKGAIQSLLMDCYQKRDMVSMIVFRKEKAEVVLSPTSSVENASKRLREIPVGGKTPLTAGLLEAYKLIKRVMFKAPETRFLVMLITDGRANHSISKAPIGEEIEKVSQLLRGLRFTDFIVVDTENKKGFIKTDLALQIASQLGADYYTIENIRSEFLTELVLIKKKELF
jgi:magnesium chelatase subunit D